MVVIKNIMNTDVFKIGQNNAAYDAAKIMVEKNISCLVVEEENRVIGIITRKDILEKIVVAKKDIDFVKVGEIMVSPVITINENATLIAASSIMKTKKIKQLPVLKDERLAGIVTQTDLVSSLGSIMLGEDGYKKE